MNFLSKPMLFAAFFLVFIGKMDAQLTLKVTLIPSNTPSGASIFVAGNFQNWQPADPNFKLTDNGNGQFSITFTPPVGSVEYKFTRGSWATVEGDANGNFQPNHVFNYTGQPTTVTVSILSWEDTGGANEVHTATWNTTILDNAFFMPQLNRSRRIWLYLPPDYYTTTKKYPVLYMHDGQNLFDAFYSFAGEWGVDEALNKLFAEGDYGCIVVGIDNGGAERINELSPWKNAQYGGGDGEKYTDFMVETLKPYIDSHYRTLTDASHTGTAGSSMGGLISMYAAAEHQSVFGKAGIFSPAFWFSDSCFLHVAAIGKTDGLRAYFVAGTNESATMVPKMQQMDDLLLTENFTASELFLKTDADGAHSEWYWKREFPACYQFLFNNPPSVGTTENGLSKTFFTLFPNPAHGLLRLKGGEAGHLYQVTVVSLEGRLMKTAIFKDEQPIAVDSIPSGSYFLRISEGEKLVANLPFLLKQ